MTTKNLNEIARPLLTKDKWDIPPESVVRIVTVEGFNVIGTCYKNPSKTMNSTDVVELVNCKLSKPTESRTITKKFYRLYSKDITDLSFTPPVVSKVAMEERLMHTRIISTNQDLAKMLGALKGTSSIAISLHGINVGRDGSVGWICISTHGVLINIDVIDKENDKRFWTTMEEDIFSNERLMKIVHNSRPMADYLFHHHAITIKNVFDTQVAELYIRFHTNRDKMPTKLDSPSTLDNSLYKWDLKPLSYCLENFLSHEVIEQEINMLKKFEGTDYTVKNPLMSRPLQSNIMETKCVAISLKHLAMLNESQTKVLNSHFNICVSEQIQLMLNGNMAESYCHITNPAAVSSNLYTKIIQGKPYLDVE